MSIPSISEYRDMSNPSFFEDVERAHRDRRIALNIEVFHDLSFTNDLLARSDIPSIVNNSKAFWEAFCKALEPNQNLQNQLNFGAFCVSVTGSELKIQGKEHIIPAVKKFVEKLRLFFADGLKNKKNFEIHVSSDYLDVWLKKPDGQGTIDLKDNDSDLSKHWYSEYIVPAIPTFLSSLGISYQEREEPCMLINKSISYSSKVKIFSLQWDPTYLWIYPIPPQPIASREDLPKLLYAQYQDGLFCDLTLVGRGGTVKAHMNFIYADGGEVLQKMFTSSMLEEREKTVLLENFSVETIRNFVEFLYLGENAFSEQFLASEALGKKEDAFELFNMAHTYQVIPLINCCSNLISLLASPEDLPRIQALEETTENEHLRQLASHIRYSTALILILDRKV